MIKNIFIPFIFILTFSGCVIKRDTNDSYKLFYFHSTKITDFNQLTQSLLYELSPTITLLKKSKSVLSPLYVTDFANLQRLANKSNLGFILSDALKTNVTQTHNWPIFAIEFTKYLKLGVEGTKLLSRKIQDIKYTEINDNTYGLVGTYSITQRQLILYLKLINLQNGVILKSATKSIELTDEIMQLEEKQSPFLPTIFEPFTL